MALAGGSVPLAWPPREGRMDPADRGGARREPGRASHGEADPSHRLSFVPPPELPTPECASIGARARAQGIDALVWLATVLLLAILFGGISSSNGLLWIKLSGPPV